MNIEKKGKFNARAGNKRRKTKSMKLSKRYVAIVAIVLVILIGSVGCYQLSRNAGVEPTYKMVLISDISVVQYCLAWRKKRHAIKLFKR